jgi:hypothetical protein
MPKIRIQRIGTVFILGRRGSKKQYSAQTGLNKQHFKIWPKTGETSPKRIKNDTADWKYIFGRAA